MVVQTVNSTNVDLLSKLMIVEHLLYIVDKNAQLRLLELNFAQRLLFAEWSHRMILLKSRQLGISTAVLALFFVEALTIPGLSVAIVSHEDRATRRLVDKLDIFHKYLPPEFKTPLFHDSDLEKTFPNGSTLYVGTAGMRAFGHGDTVHRALVSEEAYYANPTRLLIGLNEAVPMNGYLIRESTPLGDSGYYYSSIQQCIENKSAFKLVPFYWWYGEDYRIPGGSELVLESERGELACEKDEVELMLEKNLVEDQIRWMRWKKRTMTSGEEELPFPQEYISDLESCFLGPKDKVFAEAEDQLASLSLKARDPIRQDGILEIWREPEIGAKYIFWLDPAGGESPTEGDPHDGVILKLNPWGLEQVAAIESRMEQKPLAYKVAEIAVRYNLALLVVERNGVGRGVLNYLVNDIGYKNLYMERNAVGELTGKYGWNTDHYNKGKMVSDGITAVKNGSVVTYDRKLIRQMRGLINKDGKIMAKAPARDDRVLAFCGAITVSLIHRPTATLAVGNYVSFSGRR